MRLNLLRKKAKVLRQIRSLNKKKEYLWIPLSPNVSKSFLGWKLSQIKNPMLQRW